MDANKKAQVEGNDQGRNGASTAGTHRKDSILRPNGDVFLYRHLFSQLENDTAKVFERKFSRLKSLEADLGRPGISDWPEAQAKKAHFEAAELKSELDLMTAQHNYISGLTDFCLKSTGDFSTLYFELMEDRDLWKIRCERSCSFFRAWLKKSRELQNIDRP